MEPNTQTLVTKDHLEAQLHREIGMQTRWLITIMVAIQVPTWIGMIQIWGFLASIAGKMH